MSPNIADIVLNQRIDEWCEINRALTRACDAPDEWTRPLETRRTHLEAIIRRGLKRCYPNDTPEQTAAHFIRFEAFR